MIDARSLEFRAVRIARVPACPACGTRTITRLIDYDAFCGTPALAASDERDVAEITTTVLAERLSRSDDFDLIDVREPYEVQIVSIAGARVIPLGALAAEIGSLSAAREIVVFCRNGVRSANAERQLRQRDFRACRTLRVGSCGGARR